MFLGWTGLTKREKGNEKTAGRNGGGGGVGGGGCACLGVVELEEEARLGDGELGLEDGGNGRAQLLVGVGVQASDGDQLAIRRRLLGPPERDGD